MFIPRLKTLREKAYMSLQNSISIPHGVGREDWSEALLEGTDVSRSILYGLPALFRFFRLLIESRFTVTHLQGSNGNRRGRNRQTLEAAFRPTTLSLRCTPQPPYHLHLHHHPILRIISSRTKYHTLLSTRLSP